MTKVERCPDCKRGSSYFEGCSKVECPKRKRSTAQLPDYQVREFIGLEGSRKVPTSKD